ncbi:MAG: Na+/H+ antiporter subunit D [Syntrophobacteraceae bacterium]|nr:Na+/H+ antiporter subunit D [Syntrophobacteraceae bacterium]
MHNTLPLPILIPLMTAVTALFFWRRPPIQRIVGLAGSAALLSVSVLNYRLVCREGIISTQIGSWPAPFGITIVSDMLSAILVLATGFVVFIISVVSMTEIDEKRNAFGYTPLLHILTMGICGSFLTGDVFNLYVWFEVMLIGSFVLMGLGGERPQLEGTIKYVTLNLISSALFLAGVGVLYGAFGTLNMADLAQQLRTINRPGLVVTLSTLFLLAFGIKAAIFPLFFWLPASYHTPPAPVSAIFAALLTKVGVYSLIRFFTLLFVHDTDHTHRLILVLSALTMIVGILGAIVQKDYRRIVSFNLISHIGTMTVGLGLLTPLALVGTVFYLVHDIVVKTCLFLFSGILQRLGGHSHITELGGLYRRHPVISCLFLVAAFSIAGIPPLSGFWGKLMLIQAGLDAKQYWVVASILVASLLTLYSMMKVWAEAFWREPSDGSPAPPNGHQGQTSVLPRALLIPVAALVLLSALMGIWPEPVYQAAVLASRQLADPGQYIQTILGGKP